MFAVYVLEGANGVYVGQTADLPRRLQEHRDKACRTSARIGYFELAHFWAAPTRERAEKFENLLHSWQFGTLGVQAIWDLSLDSPKWDMYIEKLVSAHKIDKEAEKASWAYRPKPKRA